MTDGHDFPLLPFGAQTDSSDLSTTMKECAMDLYRQAWADYRQVGCPYGETDEAMLVWFSFQNESETPILWSGKN